VECVLINDERKRVSDLNIKTEGEGRISQMRAALRSVEKAKKSQSKKKRSNKGDDGVDDDGKASNDSNIDEKKKKQASLPSGLHESGMKLYLQRKLLVNSYNTSIANYLCKKCGRNFDSRVGLKGHLDESTCIKRAEKVKQERALRLQQIEDAALSNGIKAPTPMTAPKKSPVNSEGKPSSKTKRKKHKKWPAWLEFYPALSPWYPEIFETMKFKRGSNNTKFMQKKWDALGPGRKKIRKSRARKPQNAVYPEVLAYLFPEVRSSNSTRSKNPASSRKKGSRASGSKASEHNSNLHTPTPKSENFDESYSGNPDVHLSSTTTALLKPETPLTCETPLPPLPDIPSPVPKKNCSRISYES